MARKQTYTIRLAVENGKAVSAELTGVGKAGETAFAKLQLKSKLTGESFANMAAAVKRNLIPAMKTAAVTLGAVGAAAAALTVRQMKLIDETAKLADGYGISIEKFEAMKLVAAEGGVEFEKLNASMRAMTVNIAEAANGAKTQADAISALGLNIGELVDLSPDKQFEKIAEALAKIENPTRRAGVATKIFGEDAVALNNILDDYAQKVAEAEEFNEKWNISLSRIDASKVEQANDAFGRVKGAISGIFNTVAVEVAPAITGMSEALLDVEYQSEDFAEGVKAAMDTVAQFADRTRMAWKALGFGIMSIYADVLDFAGGTVQTVDNMVQGVLRIVNKLPGVDVKVFATGNLAESLKLDAQSIRTEIEAAAEAAVNAETVTGRLHAARRRAEREAVDAASKIRASGQVIGELGEDGGAVDKFEKRIKSLVDQTRTPLEKFQAKVAELNELMKHGLDDGTALRAWRMYRKELEDATEQTNEFADEIKALEEQTRTPLEKFAAKMERLAILVENGLDPEVAARAAKMYRDELDDLGDQADETTEAFKGLFDEMFRDLANGELSWESFGRVALKVLEDMISKQMEANRTGVSSGGSSGGFMGGIGNFIGDFLGNLNLPFFDQGAMKVPRDTLAVVHEGEAILPKPFAEDFRAGRMGGGPVEINMPVIIENNTSSQVSARRERGVGDQEMLKIMIDQAVADHIRNPGSHTAESIRRRPPMTQR